MKVIELYNKLKSRHTPRSTFGRAVKGYAEEMLESIIAGDYSDEVNQDSDVSQVKISHLINHCDGNFLSLTDKADPDQWRKVRSLCYDASYGGNFLVYTQDVMENLYPKSKRTRANEESCLEKQGTALVKAIYLLRLIVKTNMMLEHAKANVMLEHAKAKVA